MKKMVKQVVGIDVAQKELVVCYGRMYDDLTPELYRGKTFSNKPTGFEALVVWVKKLTEADIPVRFVMEATGVYHEALAYFLEERKQQISIVLPNKISNYMRTLDIKTITDKTASEAITRFGLERKLDSWKKPREIFRKVKQLTRERDQLVDERTMVKNQLHAERTEAYPNKSSLSRLKERINMLNKQEKAIKMEVATLIAEDLETQKNVDILCSIPGIGPLTGAIVLAETNDFELIRNKRQLTSYAGLDVKEKQSGTSVKGKPRISKKGNKHLRKAMHLPALTAIRHDPKIKTVYARLISKHGIKMKAVVAIQRKVLELTYVLWKKKEHYDKNYKREGHNEVEQPQEAALHELA